VLETETGHLRRYAAREHAVEALVQQAWAERRLITVFVHVTDPRRPARVVIHRAPKPFEA